MRLERSVMLAADEDHGRIYAEEIAPNLREGGALSFAHGLSIRFGLISPREDLDIFLVAPKGPGTALRRDFEGGSGLISLFAVEQDASGGAQAGNPSRTGSSSFMKAGGSSARAASQASQGSISFSFTKVPS